MSAQQSRFKARKPKPELGSANGSPAWAALTVLDAASYGERAALRYSRSNGEKQKGMKGGLCGGDGGDEELQGEATGWSFGNTQRKNEPPPGLAWSAGTVTQKRRLQVHKNTNHSQMMETVMMLPVNLWRINPHPEGKMRPPNRRSRGLLTLLISTAGLQELSMLTHAGFRPLEAAGNLLPRPDQHNKRAFNQQKTNRSADVHITPPKLPAFVAQQRANSLKPPTRFSFFLSSPEFLPRGKTERRDVLASVYQPGDLILVFLVN